MALPALEIEITADPSGAEIGFKKLERSIDGLEKATADYQRSLDRVNKAEAAGLVTSKQAAAAVRQAERAYEEAARAAAAYSGAGVKVRAATAGSTGAFSSFSNALTNNKNAVQQAGYQIGDFAVQVGAGQSALVAFSQQSSQLLGVFGMWGAVAGAAIAIAAPLGAAFLSAGGSAKTLQENLDALADALEAVNSAQDAAMTNTTDLRQRYGEYADSVREVLDAQRQIAAFEAESALADTVGQLSEAYLKNAQAYINAGYEAEAYAEILRRITRTTNATNEQAFALADALQALANAKGPEQQRAALERVRKALLDATGGVQNMDEETRKVYQSMLEAEVAAARLAALDISSNITTAANEAGRLATNLQAAAAVDYARRSGRYSGRGGDPRQFDTEGRLSMTPGATPFIPGEGIVDAANAILNPSKKGGSGGSKSDDTIGALAKSLMTQSELLENWRTESLEKLADFNAKELEALGGHAEAKLRLEAEYQKRLADLGMQATQRIETAQQAAFSSLQAFMGSLATQSKGAAKALLAINTAMSIKQAMQNTAVAATRALAELGPVLGPPAAAKIKAYGAAQVGLIAANAALQLGSAGGGASGGGGGGGGGGGASSVSTLDVNLTVQGRGDLATSPGAVDSLTDALLKNFKDRGLDVVRVRA